MLKKLITNTVIGVALITSTVIYNPAPLEAVTMEPTENVVKCNQSMEIKTYAECMVVEKWGEDHWDSFNFIILKESSWNYKAANPTSTARGLCQTMMSLYKDNVDDDFLTNPHKQIDWCIDYTTSRYSSPNNAKLFWDSNRWW